MGGREGGRRAGARKQQALLSATGEATRYEVAHMPWGRVAQYNDGNALVWGPRDGIGTQGGGGAPAMKAR